MKKIIFCESINQKMELTKSLSKEELKNLDIRTSKGHIQRNPLLDLFLKIKTNFLNLNSLKHIVTARSIFKT